MLDKAIKINHYHIEKEKLINKIRRKYSNRVMYLHKKNGTNNKVIPFCSIYDDSISLYFLICDRYLDKIMNKGSKNVAITFSDHCFVNPSRNENRIELINNILKHINKKGIKTKLKVSPIKSDPSYSCYKINLETLF